MSGTGGISSYKTARTFLKVEVAQAFFILTFKIINKGKKVVQASIILKLKKVQGSLPASLDFLFWRFPL